MLLWYMVPKYAPLGYFVFMFPIAFFGAFNLFRKKSDFWFLALKGLEITGVAWLLENFIRAFYVAHYGPNAENIAVSLLLAVIVVVFYTFFIAMLLLALFLIYLGWKKCCRFALNKPVETIVRWYRKWVKKNRNAAERIAKYGLIDAIKYWSRGY
jgi:hypothetical protein